MFENRKMYKRGLEDALHTYERFSEKQKEALEQLRRDVNSGKKIGDALIELGDYLNGIYQYLDSREKAELYQLETPIDIKDLEEAEQQLLIAMLYQLADDEGMRLTENQRAFIWSIQRYLNLTNPKTSIDLSVIGDIDSLDVQKTFLKVSLEFFYLQEREEITEEQEEFLSSFSVNKKQAMVIENSVSRLYNAVGVEGIVEKYGYVPEEPKTVITFEKSNIQSIERNEEDVVFEESSDLINLEKLTLDGTLHIKQGKRVIYQNKNIHFLATLVCEGELIFDNCVIHYGENDSEGVIVIPDDAVLTMRKCTVKAHSYIGRMFITNNGDGFEEIAEETIAGDEEIAEETVAGDEVIEIGESKEDCDILDSMHVQLIQCEFVNCVGFLQTDTSVLLDHCYIINPWAFMMLGGMDDNRGIIRDCIFYIENRPDFLPTYIEMEDSFVIKVWNLHFINSSVQGILQMTTADDSMCEEKKKVEDWSNIRFLGGISDLLIENSSFRGIRGIVCTDGISERIIRLSTFEHCYDVLCGGSYRVEECRFDLCSKIGDSVFSTKFLHCQFNDCFCELISTPSEVGEIIIDGCEFNNWSAVEQKKDEKSSMLSLTGTRRELNKVIDCTFNGIQAYKYFLIRSHNWSVSNGVRTKVKYCTFLNCVTERENEELIQEYASYLGLFDRLVTYRITDVDDCQGLEQVNSLGDHNEYVIIKDKSSSGEVVGLLGKQEWGIEKFLDKEQDDEKNIAQPEEIVEEESIETIVEKIEGDERFDSKIKEKSKTSGEGIAGIIYGNVSNASTIYGTDKFSTPRGHGFAAEQANHLYDKIANVDFFGQNKVQMVGENIDPQTGRIVKNGADRIVNGTNIQTKYCKTGGKCISECFDNGKFRYLNSDGSPMQVEVPSDKYDAAVQAMENRIKNGEVPGVSDPKEAKNIVRKGHFTYEQAKNIAKAGTVESITFDAVNGAIIATSAFGISTVLSFATSVWNGEEFDVAMKNATYTGLKVGGTTFITAVLSSQLSKAGLNSALVSSSEAIVSIMGPKASAMLVNAFRSGTNIYGAAAMKSAAKMLRGNAITGAVSVVVLSSVDVMNIFRGRISGKQLFKNVANTASTVAGGTAGWVGGATAGAAIGSAVPVIGTALGGIVGGVLGSFAGGAASSAVSNTVLGAFIEDDAEEMTEIIENVFQKMSTDYLLNQKEAENIIDELKGELSGGTLKDMFASSDRKKFARNLLIGHVEKEVKNRKKIVMPSEAEMQISLRKVLEEMADKADGDIQANLV